jgi:class 3 adenylate cyclase
MAGTRKITAIVFADIVGYSRLAGADEDRTLSRLRGLRSDLIDPAIDAHRGRIVKRTGDGSLIEFRSVVDAVQCAIEVQNGMAERNAGLPPERRIEFRVGIHLGDVVEESDGDLMGDGVNIAARLEGIAVPGAIYLSEDAYRQVRGGSPYAIGAIPNPSKVASGSGEHVVHFARNFPNLVFQPSDPDLDALPSIAAWVKATGVTNVRAPIAPGRLAFGLANRISRRDYLHQHDPHLTLGGDCGIDQRGGRHTPFEIAALSLRSIQTRRVRNGAK